MIFAKTKVKAFTLSEMLVVLLLTIIVVGLAFTILNLVQKQMGDIQSGFEANSEKNRLKQILWKDFGTYSRVFYKSETNQLVCENPKERVSYEFQENLVIRALDSFRVNIKSTSGYFIGKTIVSGEVDALELQLDDPSSTLLLIYKMNTAESFMDHGL
ncbi:MAG: hypothetical protein AAF600_18760 [Bacteroidota bacterium]